MSDGCEDWIGLGSLNLIARPQKSNFRPGGDIDTASSQIFGNGPMAVLVMMKAIRPSDCPAGQSAPTDSGNRVGWPKTL
jgi:hypothetical protein